MIVVSLGKAVSKQKVESACPKIERPTDTVHETEAELSISIRFSSRRSYPSIVQLASGITIRSTSRGSIGAVRAA